MLTKQEILERAFRAIDELAGQRVSEPCSQGGKDRSVTSQKCTLAAPTEIPPAAASSEVPTEPERAAANALLGQVGMRLMSLLEGVTVGLWSDLDGPEVRAALAVFGSDKLPIRYLDGDVR